MQVRDYGSRDVARATKLLWIFVVAILGSAVLAAAAWSVTNPATIRMERPDDSDDPAPALFRHWKHQKTYKCYVCHARLFSKYEKATDITHERMDQGKYCGACHDGRVAFQPHADDVDCEVCHAD